MRYENVSYLHIWLQEASTIGLDRLRKRLLTDIDIFQIHAYLLFNAFCGDHYLSYDFTQSAKFSLEKQTSKPSLAKELYMGSVWVYGGYYWLEYVAKYKWPFVTVYQIHSQFILVHSVAAIFEIELCMKVDLYIS